MPLMQRDGSTTYWQRPQLETRRVSSWKKLKVTSLINCAKKKKQNVTQNSQITESGLGQRLRSASLAKRDQIKFEPLGIFICKIYCTAPTGAFYLFI
jgi:hypothetical protein